MSQVTIRTDFDDTIIMPEGKYTPAYGTAGYNELYQDDKFTYCKADGLEFMLTDDQLASTHYVQLTVISGDIQAAQQLVKLEMEHYDTKVIIK